jgi:hypothetical protein
MAALFWLKGHVGGALSGMQALPEEEGELQDRSHHTLLAAGCCCLQAEILDRAFGVVPWYLLCLTRPLTVDLDSQTPRASRLGLYHAEVVRSTPSHFLLWFFHASPPPPRG